MTLNSYVYQKNVGSKYAKRMMITKSEKKTSKMAISKSTEAKLDLVGSELGYKIISMKKNL